jgi:hypothetical protein
MWMKIVDVVGCTADKAIYCVCVGWVLWAHQHMSMLLVSPLIAEFYLVDRGLRHRLPGFSSMGRLVILPFIVHASCIMFDC